MTIRITWTRLILAIAAAGVAGMFFAWSGAMQISASSGHWRITDWFLHWTMRNSVRTYSVFQSPSDPLDNTGLVSAAGHFRQSCQICHGAPGVRPSPVMQAATPPAPDLAKTAVEWTDRELFWIVRHGVKFTGMPAWAVDDRPDEVRRMAAFVRRLPRMTPAQYRAMVEESDRQSMPGIRPGVLAACTGCHGNDGRGRGQPDIPVLGGQKPAYLSTALRDYASGKRSSALMQVAVATLSEEEIARLARHFAAMPGLRDTALPTDHPALRGDRRRQLPACADCHAPGKSAPILTGQKASYLAGRLFHWQGDETVVDARKTADTMPTIARRIRPEEIDGVARALSGKCGGNGHRC